MGRAVVVDADGIVVWSGGDVETPFFPRFTAKSLLAIELVESGAVDRVGFSQGSGAWVRRPRWRCKAFA
ncbi:L-asparaginase II [Gluconobacter frateurii NBRC 103465]|nr:L-asparaginase II [Gluconobacter frateurii NBRC 103465]